MSTKHRIGCIIISDALLKDWKLMLPLFSNFIPVHIENKSYDRQLTYTGFSPLFDEIDTSEEAPMYDVESYTVKGKVVSIRFKRQADVVKPDGWVITKCGRDNIAYHHKTTAEHEKARLKYETMQGFKYITAKETK